MLSVCIFARGGARGGVLSRWSTVGRKPCISIPKPSYLISGHSKKHLEQPFFFFLFHSMGYESCICVDGSLDERTLDEEWGI